MKWIPLLILPLLLGSATTGNDTVFYEGDRIVWMVGDPGETMEQWIPQPVYVMESSFITDDGFPYHELTITQYGNIADPPGTPYQWIPIGEIQIKKQFEGDWLFRESGYLTISGFNEVNIEAGWVNINSEFGTIIDGEEAHTIFLPCVQR